MEDGGSEIEDRGSGIEENSNKVKEKIILGQFKHLISLKSSLTV